MKQVPGLDTLTRITDPQSAMILPDGHTVLYSALRYPEEGPSVSELRLGSLAGGTTALTTAENDSCPAVSPDGTTIAFVRRMATGTSLRTIPVSGGPIETVVEGLNIVGGPVYSPDGATIAFTALGDNALTETRPPLVVDSEPDHKVDGFGWVGTARTQIYVVPAGGGTAIRLTDSGYCTDPSWSPDGTVLAFAQMRRGTMDHSPVQEVGLVDPDGPISSVRFPWTETGISGPLTWTSDGSSVVAIGRLTNDIGHENLVRLDLKSRAVRVFGEALDRNVMGGGPGYPGGAPAFGPEGRLYYCVRDQGRTVLVSIDVTSENIRHHPVSQSAVISGLSISGNTALLRISDDRVPGELLALDLRDGSTNWVTSHWEQDCPDAVFLPYQSRAFTVSDGTTVHGWVLRSSDTTGPAPTLLDIHGGPHNAWAGTADTAHLYQQILAAQGWNILILNPRASDGYGIDFFTAAVGAWGEADEGDFLEPLDAMVDEGLADPDRIAVTGYSYGGYMTCWLSAKHPHRFAAAVPGGLICDLELSAATSDLGTHLRNVEIGKENEDRLSPVHYADDVSAPTLILHGQNDLRCQLDQAELWYSRMRSNRVPVRLVVYPGGSHLFILNGPVSHRQDYNQRVIDWVSRYCPQA